MNVHAQPAEPAFAALHGQERKSLLRFIACGSVDHGKSTLIGRLLYDSKQVFDDQLDALKADSRKFGTQGDALDFSLLLDGLAAERADLAADAVDCGVRPGRAEVPLHAGVDERDRGPARRASRAQEVKPAASRRKAS